jgi:hypothetical protein
LGRAMEALVADNALRCRLGAAGSKALQERSYSWTTNAGRVVDALMSGVSNFQDGISLEARHPENTL